MFKERIQESKPEGGNPDLSGLEPYRYGQFSPSEERIREIRGAAKARGEDPDEAERAYRERMEKATRNLHLEAGERVRRDLQKDIDRLARDRRVKERARQQRAGKREHR